ncbi:helix-hairpin-helix domain-containing protein [Kangiella sp. HZ709]|uniref:ComEA family DNA-binding protein n=1 Tax=Kangiella sp. HZ709 TaxID=2666328 RepID=UPI0012AFCDED|nr:helix-hairpin-helix domain-containing protein [Kangiella sp. HZ709]MRX28291.1 DNA-binding protein [Kangiella sp. HZ709]
MKKLSIVTLSVITLTASILSNIVIAKDKEPRAAVEQALARLNINTALAEQLASSLNGVGIKKAQAIVEYRETYGEFKSINELTAVKGIGEKTLEKNKYKLVL